MATRQTAFHNGARFEENMMRGLVWLILGIATIFAGSRASAEQFDTKYPVCMEVYASGGPRMDCYFWTMEQCWVKTDGMAALCVANRNYVPAVAGAYENRTRRGY
jgi:hypothetical protein